MLASAAFILFQLGRMAIVLYLPAMALSTVTGVNVYICILVMGVLSTIYTVLGGIEAVVWTDVLQVFVLLGGALFSLAIMIFHLDGGVSTIWTLCMADDKFRLANLTWDYTTTALWVMIVGNLFINLVTYTSDQGGRAALSHHKRRKGSRPLNLDQRHHHRADSVRLVRARERALRFLQDPARVAQPVNGERLDLSLLHRATVTERRHGFGNCRSVCRFDVVAR